MTLVYPDAGLEILPVSPGLGLGAAAWGWWGDLASGPVAAQHVCVALVGIKLRPAWAGLVEQPLSSRFVVEPGGAGGPGVATYTAVLGGLAVLKYYVGLRL